MLPQLSNQLYHIMKDHLRLVMQLEEFDGELSPELEKSMSLSERQLNETAISYAGVIRHYEDLETAIESEIKRLQELKKKAAKRGDLFKKEIEKAMIQFRVDTISSPTTTLCFRSAKSVVIEDESMVPLEYFDPKPSTISKTRIREDIQKGNKVPGAALVTNRHLQIK